MATQRARLVTIITRYRAEDTVRTALGQLGVHGYTKVRADGGGAHGEQASGLVESGNVLFQVVTSQATAARVLAWVEDELIEIAPSIAYAVDVDAVPAGRFD